MILIRNDWHSSKNADTFLLGAAVAGTTSCSPGCSDDVIR